MAADSSPDSSATTSSESIRLIGDTGPGPDGQAPPGAERAAEIPPSIEPTMGWEEQQLRDLLRGLGDGAHAVAGVGDADWAFIEADLDRIAPPLTRIMNRVPVLQAAAEKSDPLAVGIGFGLYGWRSAIERRTVLAREEREAMGPQAPQQPPPPPPRAPAAPPPVNGAGPTTPDGYVSYADKLRATRPQEDQ
jgi:hypothetical protein